jgi:hypothetical protein
MIVYELFEKKFSRRVFNYWSMIGRNFNNNPGRKNS